jgi:hypothetical protein
LVHKRVCGPVANTLFIIAHENIYTPAKIEAAS